MAPPLGCRVACVLVVVLSLFGFWPSGVVLHICSDCDVLARSTFSLLPGGVTRLEEVANRHDSVATLLTLDSRSKGVAEEANDRL